MSRINVVFGNYICRCRGHSPILSARSRELELYERVVCHKAQAEDDSFNSFHRGVLILEKWWNLIVEGELLGLVGRSAHSSGKIGGLTSRIGNVGTNSNRTANCMSCFLGCANVVYPLS